MEQEQVEALARCCTAVNRGRLCLHICKSLTSVFEPTGNRANIMERLHK